jgi:hypothetical protein
MAIANPPKYPNLLFNTEELGEIREKIDRYEWAKQLFERLKTDVDGEGEPSFLGSSRYTMQHPPADPRAFPDEGLNRGVQFVHQSRLHELALIGVLSGDPKYACRVRELLVVIADVLPRGNDLSQWSQWVNWTTGYDALELLVAYDLVYDAPGWTEADREKVERAFVIVMEQILAEPSARHLVNTGFYYQPYKVACGCFFNRPDWIDEGVKGRVGFFDALNPPDKPTGEMRWHEFGGEGSPHQRIQRLGRVLRAWDIMGREIQVNAGAGLPLTPDPTYVLLR